jgi:uncharacterized 2Fe-2S/4Fe-4S cluster protein (DUF4445 family)
MRRDGEVFAGSCAMGPALEGMGISCGMTADDGAVTHVREGNGALVPETIGTGEPVGMTGTAVVDLISILLSRDLVSPSGALATDTGGSSLPHPLRPCHDSGTRALGLWGGLVLTQKAIRQVQLAKAASLAASHFLLKAAGLGTAEIDRVFIAGALGEHLDLASFLGLDSFRHSPGARFEVLGSTSLKAAEAAARTGDSWFGPLASATGCRRSFSPGNGFPGGLPPVHAFPGPRGCWPWTASSSTPYL